jgi:hypothetical protein
LAASAIASHPLMAFNLEKRKSNVKNDISIICSAFVRNAVSLGHLRKHIVKQKLQIHTFTLITFNKTK